MILRSSQMGLFSTLRTARDIRDTFRDWRAFKHRTGRWPILSVITYASLWLGLIAGVILLLVYSEHHSWTKPRLMLVLMATVVPLAALWETLERAARTLDVRRCGAVDHKKPRSRLMS